MEQPSGVAAVIIGNEVLSAKVVEQNGALLIRRLRERGVPLRSLTFVPDEIDPIVEAISIALRRARHVFTSGGIGPTHDDVTVRAVALALNRRVVRMPEMEALVREHYGVGLSPETLRMAEAPEGAELIQQPGIWYPVLSCAGVYMLPGVPQLFKLQLETVLPRLEGTPVTLKALYLSLGEPEIAGVLDAIALAEPSVSIGSYPTWDRDAGYRVKVTVEHLLPGPVDEVVERLRASLPAGAVIRIADA
jgi:molybdenum cofactor synthesis domain-containing protein